MSASTIHEILGQFRDEELHNRHLGDRFERLMCRYLELDPIFADQFSNVWMWNERPQKGNVGDIGIEETFHTLTQTVAAVYDHRTLSSPTATDGHRPPLQNQDYVRFDGIVLTETF
jgi:predicted helicase